MIDEKEVTIVMENVFPELSPELDDAEKCKNVYDAVHVLADHTNEEIKKGNLGIVQKCFNLAENLHDKGNVVVKRAIENVYVFSFSHFLCHDSKLKNSLIKILPTGLYHLYLGQVINSHI